MHHPIRIAERRLVPDTEGAGASAGAPGAAGRVRPDRGLPDAGLLHRRRHDQPRPGRPRRLPGGPDPGCSSASATEGRSCPRASCLTGASSRSRPAAAATARPRARSGAGRPRRRRGLGQPRARGRGLWRRAGRSGHGRCRGDRGPAGGAGATGWSRREAGRWVKATGDAPWAGCGWRSSRAGWRASPARCRTRCSGPRARACSTPRTTSRASC